MAVCVGLLLLLVTSTQPAHLPSAMLVLPFALIFIVLVLLGVTILKLRGLSSAKSLRLSLMGSALPMLVLVLQSFGQLTIRDLLTIIALFAIAHFYLSRITRPSSEQ